MAPEFENEPESVSINAVLTRSFAFYFDEKIISSNKTPSTPNRPLLTPPAKVFWWAYAFAPTVAPVLFAVVVFVAGSAYLALNPENTGTPIGVVAIPLISLTVGVICSYFVAGVIGMPIAFLLRRRNSLNGYTIHGAALVWSMVLAVLLGIGTYANTTPPRPAAGEFLLPLPVLFVMLAPGILLSATTFWWMVCRDKRRVSLRVLFLVITAIAVLLALATAFFR
ncbi:MAG: hypothetical protein ACI87E_002924 [Mariniblastus sp.]|jgi:hypothetical protein